MHFTYFLLLFSLPNLIITEAFPQTVEIDLIFPRNETYAPTAYFPIVFAIQNYAPAWPWHLAIDWALNGADGKTLGAVSDMEGGMESSGTAITSSTEPFFMINSTKLMNNTSGQWSL